MKKSILFEEFIIVHKKIELRIFRVDCTTIQNREINDTINENTHDGIKINAYRVFRDRLNDIYKKKRKILKLLFTRYTKLILIFVENVVEKAVRPVSINMTTQSKT